MIRKIIEISMNSSILRTILSIDHLFIANLYIYRRGPITVKQVLDAPAICRNPNLSSDSHISSQPSSNAPRSLAETHKITDVPD